MTILKRNKLKYIIIFGDKNDSIYECQNDAVTHTILVVSISEDTIVVTWRKFCQISVGKTFQSLWKKKFYKIKIINDWPWKYQIKGRWVYNSPNQKDNRVTTINWGSREEIGI